MFTEIPQVQYGFILGGRRSPKCDIYGNYSQDNYTYLNGLCTMDFSQDGICILFHPCLVQPVDSFWSTFWAIIFVGSNV